MPISHKHKLIFVHIPKNAGTSIAEYFEMKDVAHHHWRYYRQIYPNEWNTYHKFAIVRNPWARVVSCYNYAKLEKSYWHSIDGNAKSGKHLDYEILKNKSFEECLHILRDTPKFLRHQGWTNQFEYIYDIQHTLMVNNVLRLENLEEDLYNCLGKKIELPKINISNNTDYKTFYKSVDMIDIVTNHYKTDINLFKYSMVI
jgi:hypothetical protein